MPWTGKSFAERHNHRLHGKAASKAAAQANAMLKAGVDEGTAIATANKRAKMKRLYTHPRSERSQSG
jgi:uncharacterized protein YdaT